MRPNYTHIVLVLDKSGSMQTIRTDTAGSVDKFIRDQKAVPGEATFQLIQFDTQHHAGPIRNIKEEPAFGLDRYQPDGYTALLDSVGKAITDTGKFLSSKPESERPERVVIVIVTDGEENSSRTYRREEIFRMVTTQRDIYKWDFVFLGANIDAFKESADLGIASYAASNFKATAAGIKAVFACASDELAKYRCDTSPDKAYKFTKKQQDDNENAV